MGSTDSYRSALSGTGADMGGEPDDDQPTPLEEIQYKREALAADERRLLEKLGWKYTSNTPGCLWLFERTMPDGRVLLVDQSTAVWITERL